MIRAIYQFLWFCRNINVVMYIHLNYFCRAVKREKQYHIYPYRGADIYIRANSKIILHGNLRLNECRDDGRFARSYISMYENSKIIIGGNVTLSHGSLIRVGENAILEFVGTSITNINLTIDCKQLIRIGNDTMVGSDVIIYDSDFHPTAYSNKEFVTHTSPVFIGDHVWIGTRAMIMKGSNIGMGSIIGANAYFTSQVHANTLVACTPSRVILKDVRWARDMTDEEIENAKMYVNG